MSASRARLETCIQAQKLEGGDSGSDRELERLVRVWKGASRRAAEEVFEGCRERVRGMGGWRAWREIGSGKGGSWGWGWDEEGKGKGNGEDGEGEREETEEVEVEVEEKDEGGDGDEEEEVSFTFFGSFLRLCLGMKWRDLCANYNVYLSSRSSQWQ